IAQVYSEDYSDHYSEERYVAVFEQEGGEYHSLPEAYRAEYTDFLPPLDNGSYRYYSQTCNSYHQTNSKEGLEDSEKRLADLYELADYDSYDGGRHAQSSEISLHGIRNRGSVGAGDDPHQSKLSRSDVEAVPEQLTCTYDSTTEQETAHYACNRNFDSEYRLLVCCPVELELISCRCGLSRSRRPARVYLPRSPDYIRGVGSDGAPHIRWRLVITCHLYHFERVASEEIARGRSVWISSHC